jgi:YHS domain-containing protein
LRIQISRNTNIKDERIFSANAAKIEGTTYYFASKENAKALKQIPKIPA